MKNKIYIAGALNTDSIDYIKNLHRMIKYAEEVRKKGFSVFAPGLDFLIGLQCGNLEYDDYFNNSQPWLEVSDAMFVVPGWEKSKGTKREIQRAKEKNIPVYYCLEELVKETDLLNIKDLLKKKK